MEVTRLHIPPANPDDAKRVRKTINPNAIISVEETTNDPSRIVVITPQEVFLVEDNYDDFQAKVKTAKIVEGDGGIYN